MLGIIGGSGLYEIEPFDEKQVHSVETPFGPPSSKIREGTLGEHTVYFLARHGPDHQFVPHEVNYRANIYALKSLGTRKILGISAAGSLREEISPGDLALVSQYFDFTNGTRAYTFFGDGLSGHVPMAEPVCPALTGDIKEAAERANQDLHTKNTYACVEGPRLGTRAESHFLRGPADCDLVGMTNIPEAFLAREAQVGYASLCMVTDYDCWTADPDKHVSVEQFQEIHETVVGKAIKVLRALLNRPLSETPDRIRTVLDGSLLTGQEDHTSEQKSLLEVLRA